MLGDVGLGDLLSSGMAAPPAQYLLLDRDDQFNAIMQSSGGMVDHLNATRLATDWTKLRLDITPAQYPAFLTDLAVLGRLHISQPGTDQAIRYGSAAPTLGTVTNRSLALSVSTATTIAPVPGSHDLRGACQHRAFPGIGLDEYEGHRHNERKRPVPASRQPAKLAIIFGGGCSTTVAPP